jgi:hypothetical protein
LYHQPSWSAVSNHHLRDISPVGSEGEEDNEPGYYTMGDDDLLNCIASLIDAAEACLPDLAANVGRVADLRQADAAKERLRQLLCALEQIQAH